MTQAASQVSGTPAPLAPPAPAAPGTPRIIINGQDVTPHTYTAADVAAMRSRRSELSNMLESAHSRRKQVQEELRRATTPADKAGLEQRLGVLDARIARLEQDIDENSTQLASQGAQQAIASSRGRNADFGSRAADRGMTFGMFMLLPVVFVVCRNIWRRGSRPTVVAGASPDTTQRLERMEQAMEAIAIEIERVSEGQRFMTRLMSENALGAGQAPMQPIEVPERVAEQH